MGRCAYLVVEDKVWEVSCDMQELVDTKGVLPREEGLEIAVVPSDAHVGRVEGVEVCPTEGGRTRSRSICDYACVRGEAAEGAVGDGPLTHPHIVRGVALRTEARTADQEGFAAAHEARNHVVVASKPRTNISLLWWW